MTLARLFVNEAETVRHWIIILGLKCLEYWNWIICGLWLGQIPFMVVDVIGPVLAYS